MNNIKSDFPIFANNPGLVYLDSGATALKPSYVINAISHYLENDYANIHRGNYSLAERSEDLYLNSKEAVADMIGGKSSEVIYTYNSTYAFNILASSLARSGMLKRGDKVMVSILEHHANVVPWLLLKEDIGIDVVYVDVDENYDIDLDDFKKKYDEKVKLVSFTRASNVTGSVLDMGKISALLREDTLFAVDASQSIPHFRVDVKKIRADFLIFTGHKMMADTGIGVLRVRNEVLKKMTPSIGGGGSIKEVKKDHFVSLAGLQGFEVGTPNLTGAVSLLAACEYIDKIGGYEFISKIEDELIKYALSRFDELKDRVVLVGKNNFGNRLGVFSFVLKKGTSVIRIGEVMAENGVCIRCGGHCAHPLHDDLGYTNGTCRASIYFYNEMEDLDKFFDVLRKIA